MKKQLLWALGAILLVAFYTTLFMHSHNTVRDITHLTQTEQQPATTNRPNTKRQSLETDSANSPTQNISNLAIRTETLKATQVDGSFKLDRKGNLIANTDAIKIFDYFLLTQGEIGERSAIALIQRYIEEQLTAPADQQALDLLDQYNRYRHAHKQQQLRAIADIDNLNITSKTLSMNEVYAQYQSLNALRNEIFGAHISQQIFNHQEEQLQLKSFAIGHDKTLSTQQKQQQLTQLYQQSSAVTNAGHQTTLHSYIQRDTIDNMKSNGASDHELWAYRQQQFGTDAAQRLAELDQQRADWNRIADNYLAQKRTINSNPQLSAKQKQQQLQHLKLPFSTTQQLRLDAYEKTHNLSPQ